MSDEPAVKEIPVRYKTSDGHEHATKADAERRQALIDAEREYEQAKRRYGRVLAQTQVTADGKPFRFGVFHEYWRIAWVWGDRPVLEQVPYFGYETEINRDSDRIEIVQYEPQHQSHGLYRRRCYAISEMYASRGAAAEVLEQKEAEWLRDYVHDKPHLQVDLRRDGQ